LLDCTVLVYEDVANAFFTVQVFLLLLIDIWYLMLVLLIYMDFLHDIAHYWKSRHRAANYCYCYY